MVVSSWSNILFGFAISLAARFCSKSSVQGKTRYKKSKEDSVDGDLGGRHSARTCSQASFVPFVVPADHDLGMSK